MGKIADLMGKVVVVTDSTGSSTEGTLEPLECVEGIWFVVLSGARQINYFNATTSDPPTPEAWEVGEQAIALHLTARICLSYFAPRRS